VNVGVCFALIYRCFAALLWLVVLVIDYCQLISLTHPLLQFDVWGQELHEEFMLEWVQIFCEVVCNVICRFNVRYDELPLSYAVPHPVEAHVNCLRAFLFYRVSCDANGAGIVAHNYSRRLRVTKIRENSSKTGCLLRSCEESSVFGFASARHDAWYNRRINVCSSINVEGLFFIA
jgi:hypothetical protein